MEKAPKALPIGVRRSLAVYVASALAAAFPAVAMQVTDCGDTGPGTLREALLTDSVIDVSACSQITLSTGELVVPWNNANISGNHTLVTASGASRVFSHTGSGALTLWNLEIADGAVTGLYAAGGCIASQGTVQLLGTTVRNCTVTGQTNPPAGGSVSGGGIYARESVSLDRSIVRDNTLVSGMGTYSYARGGGVFASGDLTMSESTISGNTVVGRESYCRGGGAEIAGGVGIYGSTISGNDAPSAGGATFGTSLSTSFLVNSTVSGNHAHAATAGIVSSDATLHISNSTIAFNEADGPAGASSPIGAGLFALAPNAYLFLRSSIIARNTRAGSADDLNAMNPMAIAGSHNVIIVTNRPLPADTITVDPMLAPLADNGGRVRTHALRAGSPGIDRGDNFLLESWDARGNGFDRVAGAAADIGAYEVQADLLLDRIFDDGFD